MLTELYNRQSAAKALYIREGSSTRDYSRRVSILTRSALLLTSNNREEDIVRNKELGDKLLSSKGYNGR